MFFFQQARGYTPDQMTILLLIYVFSGLANAFGFLVRAMAADVSDEVRLETGRDRTAKLYALVTSTGMFGSTVSVGVAYCILPLFGFVAKEGYHNTPDAMWGLQACYLAQPVICVLIGGLCMFGYKLDEARHAEIRVALGVKKGNPSVTAS